MKKQKDIINDLKSYHDIVLKHAIEARKKYYLEDIQFYRNLRFDDFLDNRSKLYMLEDIMGIEKSNIEIVIYA